MRPSGRRQWIQWIAISAALLVLAYRAGGGDPSAVVTYAVAGFTLWAALLVAAEGVARYQAWRDDRWWGR